MAPTPPSPFSQPEECTLPCIIAVCAFIALTTLLIYSSLVLAWYLAHREPQEMPTVEPEPASESRPHGRRRSRWQQNYWYIDRHETPPVRSPGGESEFGRSFVSPVESPSATASPLVRWQAGYRYFDSSERLVLSPEMLSPGVL